MKAYPIKNKEITNAGWLIGGKVAQMLLSLMVGVFSARYLGPENYGLIHYGNAYIAFSMAFCTLGLNSVIIKDFVDHPEDQGKSLGSSIALRLISSLCSMLMIVTVVSILDNSEPETIVVVALSSVSLLFHAFDTINYWFQSRYQSKVTAIATFVAYAAASIYQIVLLLLNKGIKWFAFATSVDYIVLALVLLAAYKRSNGPRLSLSWSKSKMLLGKSYHYILSGMMVAIYGQTDKLMLKQMLDETAVGYYSMASSICGMWVFILQAVIDSVYPTILRLHGTDAISFKRKNKQLYAFVFYISIAASMFFMLFGDGIICVLYGEAYMGASAPLKIITWCTAFSYLGVAREAWIVCEHKQRYLKYIYMSAASLNVVLNAFFIPKLGASGAALASLITQISTSIILPLVFGEIRQNAVLMLQAITLNGVFLKKTDKQNRERK